MKKILILIFMLFPVFSYSQEKKYSYSYIDINATYSNDIGYVSEISLGLPAGVYLKGSIRNENTETKNTIYDKTRETVAVGYHTTIADIFKNVTKSGFAFNFARIMDIYTELGVNQWELISPENDIETGSDLYAKAGIRTGNGDGWELDLFLESTKMADVEMNPVTQKIEYSLEGELNNNIGFKFINNATNNFGYSLGLSHDDFSGLTPSIGIRISL